MNHFFKRTIAAILSCVTTMAFLPLYGTQADEARKTIVVLGDGISAGRYLDKKTESYVSFVEQKYDAEVVNLARDVCYTAELLTELDDPSVKAQLEKADVILFSAGLQDVMEPFLTEFDRFKQQYNIQAETMWDLFIMDASDWPDDPSWTTEEEKYQAISDILQNEADGLIAAMQQNMEESTANMLKIGDKLAAYSNAVVVCPNVYNALSLIRQYNYLTGMRKTGYIYVKNGCKNAISKGVNTAYAKFAEAPYNFKVIDTYTMFDKLAYQYTGLNEMRFEPNAAGHALIAENVTAALAGVLPERTEPITEPTTEPTTDPDFLLGDVDADKAVNANDATAILVAAARIGTGTDSGLSAEARAAADINNDGVINAKDANIILRYAAAVGIGEKLDIRDFVD